METTSGQIDRIGAQQVEPAGTCDVVQRQADIGSALPEGFHDPGQQIQDGRAARRDVELAGIEALDLVAEDRVQPVEAFDQGLRQLVQDLAFAARGQPSAHPFEQLDPQFALQRLQLEGDRGLADIERLGRAGHRAQARGLAKGTQRLQFVRFVGESGGGCLEIRAIGLRFRHDATFI